MNISAFLPVNSSEFIVLVDAAEPCVSGSVYHRNLPEGRAFSNVSSLALTIEDVLDYVDQAKLTDSVRASTLLSPGAGRLATFRIDVMFRQHYSWQGRMVWVERGVEVKFRSFLELILAMNDILADDSKGPEGLSPDGQLG